MSVTVTDAVQVPEEDTWILNQHEDNFGDLTGTIAVAINILVNNQAGCLIRNVLIVSLTRLLHQKLLIILVFEMAHIIINARMLTVQP